MKKTKIPCDYLVRDRSERAAILFSVLAPCLSAGMTYLDIGCGTAPLVRLIDESFPPARYVGIDLNTEAIRACEEQYPHHEWICIKSEAFPIDDHYDVIIHTGVNSPRFNDAEIHERVLAGSASGPSVVLIESGDYHDGPSDTRETYDKLGSLYRYRGFSVVREDILVISHFPVPVRRYMVFMCR